MNSDRWMPLMLLEVEKERSRAREKSMGIDRHEERSTVKHKQEDMVMLNHHIMLFTSHQSTGFTCLRPPNIRVHVFKNCRRTVAPAPLRFRT